MECSKNQTWSQLQVPGTLAKESSPFFLSPRILVGTAHVKEWIKNNSLLGNMAITQGNLYNNCHLFLAVHVNCRTDSNNSRMHDLCYVLSFRQEHHHSGWLIKCPRFFLIFVSFIDNLVPSLDEITNVQISLELNRHLSHTRPCSNLCSSQILLTAFFHH